MSAPAFTPGPWSVKDLADLERAIEADGYGIAAVWDCNGNQENIANARLIAAAPDYDAFTVDALPQLEVLHSTLSAGEARKAVWRVILSGRLALAKARAAQ